MADTFKVELTELETTITTVKNIEENLKEAKKIAVKLLKDIQDDHLWVGRHKQELEAVLDILTQYHKDLCSGKDNPIKALYKSFEKLQEEVTDYTSDSKSYESLKNVC